MRKPAFFTSFRKRKGLLIIITAALLLELLSGAQYYFTHQLMEDELEKRAEGELTMKAILVKSTLNASEEVLKNFIWKLQAHLSHPDSAHVTINRMVKLGDHLQGCGVGFVPDYYPQKGRLYEVYARRAENGAVEVEQIGGPAHDYTKSRFYQQTVVSKDAAWIGPYEDKEGAKTWGVTYAMPLFERNGSFGGNTQRGLAGVAAVDVSLKWLGDTINCLTLHPLIALNLSAGKLCGIR